METNAWNKSQYKKLYEALASHHGSRIPLIPPKNISDIPEAIDYLLEQLAQEEKDMILAHYRDKKTYAEMETQFGVSRQRIRQKVNIIEFDMIRYDGDLFLCNGYAKGMDLYHEKAEKWRMEMEDFHRNSVVNLRLPNMVMYDLHIRGINTLDDLRTWLDDPGPGIRGIGAKHLNMIHKKYDQYINSDERNDPLQIRLEDLGVPRTTVLKLQKIGINTVGDMVLAEQQEKLVPTGNVTPKDIRAAKYYTRPWLKGHVPATAPQGGETPLQEYELKNPSDPYTFLANDLETAALVAFALGAGAYGAKPKAAEEENVPIFLLGGAEEWYAEQFGHSVEEGLKTKNEALSDALASMMYGHFEDRRRYNAALDAITDPDKREQFIKEWQDGISSLNDIGTRAHNLAKMLKTKTTEGANNHADS